jgi:phage tail-like protein
MATDPARSSYLGYLPAVYSEADERAGGFLARFLLAFENVLTGVGSAESPGLEEVLDGGPVVDVSGTRMAGAERFFDPGLRGTTLVHEQRRAPDDFLPWLAGWFALVPRGDVDSDVVRTLIADAIPLYRRRGTKEGLRRLLRIYALDVEIEEPGGRFELGVSSTLGVDTWLGGTTPHYFKVTTLLPEYDAEEKARRETLLRAIIDAEKPIQSSYDLEIKAPQVFELGRRSTIGRDTVLL